jgi:IS4 transposase
LKYIQGLQNALEQLKVLYQNPGCLTEKEYYNAIDKILEEFDFREDNIFQE